VTFKVEQDKAEKILVQIDACTIKRRATAWSSMSIRAPAASVGGQNH